MTRVFLGIGSNIEPETHIAQGLRLLRARFDVVQESPWYRSPAQGFTGPDFINLVVEIAYEGSLAKLRAKLRALEQDCGRPEFTQKYSSRTLDVDILLFGSLAGQFDGVKLPRADVRERIYVLKPLLDIAPDLCDPKTGAPLQQALPRLARQSISPLELVRGQ
ncbi:MAG: hypothetical protein RL217_680 [Pseudomonadota bacterium]|jgi:2-amino-4-hydroxy-6-hydroxymethyldihydropteridine diphosphokinase